MSSRSMKTSYREHNQKFVRAGSLSNSLSVLIRFVSLVLANKRV